MSATAESAEQKGRRRPSGWSCCLSGDVALPLELVSVSSEVVLSSCSADTGAKVAVVRTSASVVEDALDDVLAYPPDDDINRCEEEDGDDPVKAYLAEDAHLLRCRRPPPPDPASFAAGGPGMPTAPTILGLIENAGLYGVGGGSVPVDVSLYRPKLGDGDDADAFSGGGMGGSRCGCSHPRGDWSPHDRLSTTMAAETEEEANDDDDDAERPAPPPARLRIVDLTEVQSTRRRQHQGKGREGQRAMPLFDSTVGACHLLRSVLQCFDDDDRNNGGKSLPSSSSHCASPWSERYSSSSPSTVSADRTKPLPYPPCQKRDTVIALVVLGHFSNDDDSDRDSDSDCNYDAVGESSDQLELSELRSLVSFRTGDASPSYYLHCSAEMWLPRETGIESILSEAVQKAGKRNGGNGDGDEEGDFFATLREGNNIGEATDMKTEATLLVYRHLPPRDHVTVEHALGKAAEEEAETTANLGGPAALEEMRRWHCLWEAYIPPAKDDDEDGDDERPAPQAKPEHPPTPELSHRLVASPYQSHSDLYPSALSDLLDPANLSAIIAEARSIPQWTAWPETTHYSATPDGSVSWTVFPLCHTFPASDPAKRKFISKTCHFVPRTTELLRGGELGKVVRTALFSRLAPGTNLGAHTGWADLANHVLRVHIPLVVPGSDGVGDGNGSSSEDSRQDGLCGTWVDGCIETHTVGVPVVFDDSKVHRAFNYAEEDRIVLIVDLARPGDKLPEGTATGGHTEELDEFIKELT